MTLPIKAKRLYITEFNADMAESVHLASLDEDNRKFQPDEVFETVEDAREAVTALMSFYAGNDSPLVYPVILNDGRHIGHVQTVPIDSGWEVGYHIAKPFTGRGYATEAVIAFLPFITNRLGIPQIFGICRADNIASRKVLEKCGFVLELELNAPYHGEEHCICRYRRSLAFSG
jgi:RimJ/RimL family protein N-acetyltransferase